MFKWLEKWAIKRIVKRIIEKFPEAKDKLSIIWQEHSTEIFEKIVSAIEKVITDLIKKSAEKK